MNPKDIIQARIDELEQELHQVVMELGSMNKDTYPSMTEAFAAMEKYKDKVLALRSGIAELKNVKGLI